MGFLGHLFRFRQPYQTKNSVYDGQLQCCTSIMKQSKLRLCYHKRLFGWRGQHDLSTLELVVFWRALVLFRQSFLQIAQSQGASESQTNFSEKAQLNIKIEETRLLSEYELWFNDKSQGASELWKHYFGSKLDVLAKGIEELFEPKENRIELSSTGFRILFRCSH